MSLGLRRRLFFETLHYGHLKICVLLVHSEVIQALAVLRSVKRLSPVPLQAVGSLSSSLVLAIVALISGLKGRKSVSLLHCSFLI